MAPLSLLLTNLDFEYEWSISPSVYHANKAMRSRCRQWQHILRLLPGHQDAIALDPGLSNSDLRTVIETQCHARPEGTRLQAWGQTPRTASWQALLGQNDRQDTTLVARANDKIFSHKLEQELGVGLPHARTVKKAAALDDAFSAWQGPWVLKHPWGVSGRERVLGQGPTIYEGHLNWAQRQWDKGTTLLFEPWVAHKREVSVQYEITDNAEVAYLGACQLLVGAQGTFRGHRVTQEFHPHPQVREVTHQATQTLATMGYVGPVGFDTMQGELDGQPVIRPITEINARQNFGGLALHLGQQAPPGWSYTWWHPSRQQWSQHKATHPAPPELTPMCTVPGLYRLPEWADPTQASCTMVLIAPTLEDLQVWEARFDVGRSSTL